MSPKTVALIVAHPDDETLWAGGTILSHPEWRWFIVCLCRGSDPDRAPKFSWVLRELGAEGIIGDLDDGPEQIPLQDTEVEQCIMELLPATKFDLVITHNPAGEYTRHLRHEETGRAVVRLRDRGDLQAGSLWLFAYEDGGRQYLPKAVSTADLHFVVPPGIWQRKYNIITNLYGFREDSWEASTTPKEESFWIR